MGSSHLLTAESAEILGAIIGDKGTVKRTRRYGWYGGYDLSKYHRCIVSICLGKDAEWGSHISELMFRRFAVRGSVCRDGADWRFISNSTRVFEDLTHYYKPEWNARTWRVLPRIFGLSSSVKHALLRGYFDADGYPYFNQARRKVLVQVNSVNEAGLVGMKRILESLGYHPGLYRRYKERQVWELTIHRSEEVTRFHSEIGFSISRKQGSLQQMLRRKESLKKGEIARGGFERPVGFLAQSPVCGSLSWYL